MYIIREQDGAILLTLPPPSGEEVKNFDQNILLILFILIANLCENDGKSR